MTLILTLAFAGIIPSFISKIKTPLLLSCAKTNYLICKIVGTLILAYHKAFRNPKIRCVIYAICIIKSVYETQNNKEKQSGKVSVK